VSVCLSAKISGTTRAIFTKLFVRVFYGHGSVFLWHHCNTLCASGFVDASCFFNNGPYSGKNLVTSLPLSQTETNFLVLKGIILTNYCKITCKLK